MRKLFIITALVFMAGAAFSQIPVRVGLYVIRSSDTIYLRPNQFTTGGHLWNEIKSTNPLWLRADSVFKYTGGSQWWEGTTGLIPTTGAGTRMMYVPSQASLSGGSASSTQMDVIGNGSITWGSNINMPCNYTAGFGYGNTWSSDVESSFGFGKANVYQAGKKSYYSQLGGNADTINSISWAYVGGYGNYTASDYSFIHSLSSKITGGTASSILGGFSNRNYGAANSVILGGHALYLQAADSNVVLMNRQIIRHGWGKNLTEWQRRSGTVRASIDTSGNASFQRISYELEHAYGYIDGSVYAIPCAVNVPSTITNLTTNLFTVVEQEFMTYAGDTIRNTYAGSYLVQYSFTINSGNGNDFRFSVWVNSLEMPERVVVTTTGASNYVCATGFVYLDDIAALSNIKFRVTNLTNNDDPIIRNANVFIRKMY